MRPAGRSLLTFVLAQSPEELGRW